MPTLDSRDVKDIREERGGQLAPQPWTKTRWYPADLERAIIESDNGYLSRAACLWRSCKRDGTFMGVLGTRTAGLVALPMKFQGRSDIVEALKTTHKSVRSVFDEMCPSAELEQLVSDAVGLGIAVGELLPVKGRDYPVLVRLDPQWLVYRWSEDRWYYQSVAGLIPITPGDGRWVMLVTGGRVAPWQNGIWQAIGDAFIRKSHSQLYDTNWQSKLANPARVATAPLGATEEQTQVWWRAVMAWGVNTVFGAKPGYKVELLESNGRGYESFDKSIARAERDMIIATAGQSVTTDGGTGFANADIHKSIRADLIATAAKALAYTVNTHIIPQWVVRRFGIDALDDSAIVSWDVTPPKELKATAESSGAAAEALTAWTVALAPFKRAPDVATFCNQFGLTLQGDVDGDGVPDEEVELPIIDEGAEPENDNSEDVNFDDEEAA